MDLPVAETLDPILSLSTQTRLKHVLLMASQTRQRLATAESCTGGILASLLTDVPGRSHVFEAGFVTYTNAAKIRMLGVAADLLDLHGAVSRPVALAMAEGALAHSTADVALAITGFAGPGEKGEEAGLVHLACARRGGVVRHVECHFATLDRGETRLRCIDTALDLLMTALAAGDLPG